MCGIAGSISLNGKKKVNRAVLQEMSDAMKERGPDGEGISIVFNGRVGLVHRRLAIVDLSREADQPMSSQNDDIHLVFNGEIYNHQELREQINKIHKVEWKTDHSDTEVIIHAYEVWGIRCIKKFRGMFAFALWDQKREKLWLVRDRLGIKPLYYSRLDGKLNFASSVRAMLKDKEQDRTIDKKAVFDFLSLLAVPAPNTLFRNIKKVPAGNCLEISADGKIKKYCYWNICKYARAGKMKKNETDISEELLDLLRDSTETRKMADVPVGVFLSGGIDSSTNLALFSSNTPDVRTFTAGYTGTRNYKNENDYAGYMAGYCNAIHHDRIIGEKDVLQFIDILKKMSDDPIADPVVVSQYYIARLARENGIKVVQVGEGSDELFAGYTYWHRQAQLEKLNYIIPGGLKKLLYDRIRKHCDVSESTEELLRRGADGEATFWGSGVIYIGENRKKKLFSKEFMEEVGEHRTWDNFSETYKKCGAAVLKETTGWMGCVNMVFRLPELLLARTDRSCMAVGVEGRVPFLDHQLVEWGMRIPGKYKIRKGSHKHILKAAVKNILPESIINREKEGFGLPFTEWYDGELGRVIKQNIDYFVHGSGFFVEREVRKFMRDRTTNPTTIWALFVLSLWWQEYAGAEHKECLAEG